VIVEFAKDIIRLFFWFPVRWLTPVLPRYVLMKIGALLGLLLYFFASERRRTILDEMKRCLPDRTASELQQTVKRSFICFVKDQCDVLLYPRLDETKTAAMTHITGLEHLESCHRDAGGCILLLCHLGPNQFLMPALGHRGFQIGQVSLPADAVNIVFADHKISPVHRKVLEMKRVMEESLPSQHIFLEKGLWEALQWLRSGRILAIAVDGRHGHRFTPFPFCGRPAQYSPAPFLLSFRNGAPLLPTFIVREQDDRHHVIIGPPLSSNEQKTDWASFLQDSMKEYITKLEYHFTKYPEQYGMFFYLARTHTAGKPNALFLD